MEEDEEFDDLINFIEDSKPHFSDHEQSIIGDWISKLSMPYETKEEKQTRNEYAKRLLNILDTNRLAAPFDEAPPKEGWPSFSGKKPKGGFPFLRLPCLKPKGKDGKFASSTVTKITKRDTTIDLTCNQFENAEEMAKVIARSKGQTFAEFVVAISRHTVDYGRNLRAAMKAETTSFKEYVENVLSQRIKDLTEVLDEEQNAELLRIKKDIDKWQVELSHCKKRIREMIPDFDMDLYKKDKNYLRRIFTINENAELPEDDSFKKWREETCHRLKWYAEMINQLTKRNDQLTQEITNLKLQTVELERKRANQQQNDIQFIRCKHAENQKLKQERDRLNKENAQLLSRIEAAGD